MRIRKRMSLCIVFSNERFSNFNFIDRLQLDWKTQQSMKVSQPLKGVCFAQKSSKSIAPSAKKISSHIHTLESQKTTERIYTDFNHKPSEVMGQKTKKLRGLQPSIPHSKRNQENIEKKQNEQNQLIQEIKKLRAQISTLRRNHKEEIEFYLNQELNMAVNVEKLLASKQYRRLFTFIQHQIFQMKKRMEEISQSKDGQIGRPLPAESTYLDATIGEDIELRTLTDHLQENIQEIGMENVGILPQIKKLMSETDLSVKRLSWYFSKVPFDLPSKQACNSLATKIIQDLGCSTGEKVMEIIVNQAKTTKSQAVHFSDSDSGISKIIELHSLCIL